MYEILRFVFAFFGCQSQPSPKMVDEALRRLQYEALRRHQQQLFDLESRIERLEKQNEKHK